MAACYFPPSSSKYYNAYNCDLFHELECKVSFYFNIRKLLIFSDLNRSTNVLKDYISHDSLHDTVTNNLNDYVSYEPDAELCERTNPDIGRNEFGM